MLNALNCVITYAIVLECLATQALQAGPRSLGHTAEMALAHGVWSFAAVRRHAMGECSDSDTNEIGIPCALRLIIVCCSVFLAASRQCGMASQLMFTERCAKYIAPTLARGEGFKVWFCLRAANKYTHVSICLNNLSVVTSRRSKKCNTNRRIGILLHDVRVMLAGPDVDELVYFLFD